MLCYKDEHPFNLITIQVVFLFLPYCPSYNLYYVGGSNLDFGLYTIDVSQHRAIRQRTWHV